MSTHIYFDLDGTLTDPYEGITKCILYALDELGFPHPSDEYLLSCIGPPLYDTFPVMVGQELTSRAIDLYRERFNDVGWHENEPYDGIHDALADLSARGHAMYVAARSRTTCGQLECLTVMVRWKSYTAPERCRSLLRPPTCPD